VATPSALKAEQLFRPCRFDHDFETTDDLSPLTRPPGQDRAEQAIAFALSVRSDGYNLFALGPSGTGRRRLLTQLLEAEAAEREAPPDLCYIFNFDTPRAPRALHLPCGMGSALARAMDELIDEVIAALPAVFDSEEYKNRKQAFETELEEARTKVMKALEEDATARKLAIARTPVGFALLPRRGDEVLPPEAFNALPDEEKEAFQKEINELQEQLEAALAQGPALEREMREKVRALNAELTSLAVGGLIGDVRSAFEEFEQVDAMLEAVEADLVEAVHSLLVQIDRAASQSDDPNTTIKAILSEVLRDIDVFDSYRVNVLVDRSGCDGAPVVYEDKPTFANLIGRIEHRAEYGVLSTDFALIRPGALHKANGGFLLLEAAALLRYPQAWDELKRCLRSNEVRIESAIASIGLASTELLEPEPVALDVRVALVGERLLYYLLSSFDPDFGDLFKVAADFETDVEREGGAFEYARLVAGCVESQRLRPFAREAVARVIEQAARRAEDSERLSTHMDSLSALLEESDYWAGVERHDSVQPEDVDAAIRSARARDARAHDRLVHEIERGTIRVDLEGSVVGQVNGLSVSRLGRSWFGRPTRITARARLGRGNVLDIEREVELGGPIHSKGVLILSGYLGARYAAETPLALAATIVFEQSYGGVDGDSASLAELCALLSAIAEAPVDQRFAVTGSVDQLGRVQAVGGVNAKLEGLLAVSSRTEQKCAAILPESNTRHLMLSAEALQAVSEERFELFAVAHVDEAMELLTGLPAGVADDEGVFPEGSLNRRVADRLQAYALRAKELKAN